MTLDADEVVVASSGSLHVAPLGTAGPTSPSADLPADWVELGYVSGAGATVRSERELADVPSWLSLYPAGKVEVGRELVVELGLQQWNEATVPVALGGGAVPGSASPWTYTPDDEVLERAFVLSWSDGDRRYRLVLPRAAVRAKSTTLRRGSAAELPLELRVVDFTRTEPYYLLAELAEEDTDVRPLYQSGRYYVAPAHTSFIDRGLTLNRAESVGLWVPSTLTVDRLGVLVTSAGGAGAVARLGVYADNGTGTPDALLLDAGTVAATSTGFRQVTVSDLLLEGPAWFWLTVVAQVVSFSTRGANSGQTPLPVGLNFTPAAGLTSVCGYSMGDSVSGALPSTYTPRVPTSSEASSWVYARAV